MKDGNGFPAELAFAGKCGNLVDGGSEVFDEQTQTIDPRIEVHTVEIVITHTAGSLKILMHFQHYAKRGCDIM